MNWLQLTNRLKHECGVSGADMTTVIGTTGEGLRLANWINAAWMSLQTLYQDWEWMRDSASFITVQDQGTYTSEGGMFAIASLTSAAGTATATTVKNHGFVTGDLVTINDAAQTEYNVVEASVTVTGLKTFTYAITGAPTSPATGTIDCELISTQTGVTTFGKWDIETLRSYVTATGTSSEVLMTKAGYDEWRDRYLLGTSRDTRGQPIVAAISPSKALCLGPIPDAGYTVTCDYFHAPTELALDNESPAMPKDFHLAIVYRAMMHYGAYEAAPEVYQRGEAEYKRILRRMTIDRLDEMVVGDALA